MRSFFSRLLGSDPKELDSSADKHITEPPPISQAPQIQSAPALTLRPTTATVDASTASRDKRLRQVVIDVETTGFSARSGDKIVSIAVVELFDCNVTGSNLAFTINPGRKIPIEASRVHGIYDRDLFSAPRFDAVAQNIRDFIGDSCIVGYNVQFDLEFLRCEFEFLGIEFPPFNNSSVDVMNLVQCVAGGGRRKLHVACQEFGIDISNLKAHSATDDAMATAHLYSGLRCRCSEDEWSRLSQPVLIEFEEAKPERYYEDDTLQSAWELFESREYDKAVQLVQTVIDLDAMRVTDHIDPRPYELATMILRRQKQLDRELQVLETYFRRTVKPNITIEEITALAEPPAPSLIFPAAKTSGFRPKPYVWEMAARVVRLVELGNPIEDRLIKALKSIPLPFGYEETAITLRKMIFNKEKSGGDFSDQLDALYKFAQQHAFLYEEWFDKDLDCAVHVIVERIPRDDLQLIQAPYAEVGYQFLPLLKKTDIRRLVEKWGEPLQHASMRKKLAERWEKYRKSTIEHRNDSGL